MDTLAHNAISLSVCGQYFSYCTLDGQLKIWDTLSGHLKQEYTPSSHLSTTCVSISWPDRCVQTIDSEIDGSPKTKRRRRKWSDVSQEVHDLELLALGTVNGDVLLYSVVKSDIHSRLTDGHEDRVNDMSWLTANDSLFSCSNDKHVIEWCISTKKMKKKWSPDKSTVSAIFAIDSTNVLIASHSIKWLDWEKRVVLKHFSGHASEVHRLRHVRPLEGDIVLGTYFMSSAVGDQLINAWQLKCDRKVKVTENLAAFSLGLSDESISLDISPIKPKHPILITVVTKSGLLYIFEHIPNGHRRTPISPKMTIQILTPNSKKSSSKQLSILSAQMCNENEVLIIYGSLIKPIFERINYENFDKNTTLVRKDSTELSVPSLLVDTGFTKIKSPLKPKNATVVGPAGMAPTRHTMPTNDVSVKEKKETKAKQNQTLLSFEERLRIENDVKTSSTQQPRSDSLTHVLVQGLQSNDKQMLDTVMKYSDERVIRNTIKRLPIDCISMFLRELQNCLFNKSEQTMVYLKWLEVLLQLRLTFIMTLPNIEEEFAPLIELMNARTHVLDRIYRLKGRLDLIISQIQSQSNTKYISRQKPRIEYESSSESSDEDISDDMKELIADNSDNECEDNDENESSDESIDPEDNDNYMSEDNEDADEEENDSNCK